MRALAVVCYLSGIAGRLFDRPVADCIWIIVIGIFALLIDISYKAEDRA